MMVTLLLLLMFLLVLCHFLFVSLELLNLAVRKVKPMVGTHLVTQVLEYTKTIMGSVISVLTSGKEEESVLPKIVSLDEVDLGDITMDVDKDSKEIAEYCLPLLIVEFCGQSNPTCGETDKANTKSGLHLGIYLSLLDKFLRAFDDCKKFTGEEEEYRYLLKLVALKRYRNGDETIGQCYNRLIKDSKRFVNIYKQRGVKSEELCDHQEYWWGCRQQLLSGKVISDWADRENGPLDPIFGVLLNPTAGRVGAGDSGWLHDILFADRGHLAYHSAVHDAFGYSKNFHDKGPGYNYMKSSLFNTHNPLAGQLSGMKFWEKVLADISEKRKVLKPWRY